MLAKSSAQGRGLAAAFAPLGLELATLLLCMLAALYLMGDA